MTLMNKRSLLLALLIGCLFLTYYVNVRNNLDIVYSHLFYIPITLCGIWYYKKAVYLSVLLGLVHIGADYYTTQVVSISPLMRAGVFIFVGYLVGTISEKRDLLKDQLEKINSAMLDFVCEVRLDGTFGYVSSSVKHTLGYEADELTGTPFIELVHPDDKALIRDIFDNALKNGTELRIDYRCLDAEGNYIWMESLANPITTDGVIVVYVFGSRDISYRKQMEEELKHLSFHDALTGLYNRRFFEEQMQILDGGRADPISVISCDIDGLKLINDHFGHHYGDELIVMVARILKKEVRADDIVARIGGDEFAVMMPRCNAAGADEICRRIKEALKDGRISIKGMELPVMLSVGRAARDDRSVSISVLLKAADDFMYTDKKGNATKKVSVYSPFFDQAKS